MSAEARLAALEIDLPEATAPVAAYVTYVQTGSLAFTSGHIPQREDGSLIVGKVGRDLTAAEGADAARAVGLALLATLRANLGSLDRVKRVVKMVGMVNSDPDFNDHPIVVNGCSELLVDVFGDAGKHARSAVGVAALPLGVAVEIELIVEIA